MKLVRQAGAKTNDLCGDGSTTSIVLARGVIDEGVKVIGSLSQKIALLDHEKAIFFIAKLNCISFLLIACI